MADQSYEIRPVVEEDFNNVLKLIQQTFHIDEPMNQAVGLCVDGSCKELDDYCLEALGEGFSFVAVAKDGEIVGCLVNAICHMKEIIENENPYDKEAEKCKNPKFKKILEVLAIREITAKIWEKFPKDKQYVDVKIAATHPDFRKRGIMNRLLAETEDGCKIKGIGLLRMDTSSAYSAMSAERLGFKCISSTAYKDIKKNGLPVLLPEPPHVDDRVYVKRLTLISNY